MLLFGLVSSDKLEQQASFVVGALDCKTNTHQHVYLWPPLLFSSILLKSICGTPNHSQEVQGTLHNKANTSQNCSGNPTAVELCGEETV